ncbi:antibiotic biosynthesis monooxygenase [Sphingomonas sp. AOB5]|uniref:antibiotic biosynthesis monooxygenase family protein n=1 Tax=Sphingomonas sp. AOB5 TaxID=3034017 RepID=UPI0023FA1CC4|nr:antibiotic biosynthesis monooxygenase family protein [Sphingomonas sp. AOB5]MDF7775609.1 antibiotic biosynthesis monooxygenase [Sphingomonas sp. AOB5]
MPGPEIRQVDRNVSFVDQLASGAGPVVLINTFHVEPGTVERMLECYALDAAFMRAQPGCISAQLHRGVGNSSMFVNYAVWESAEALDRARSKPEFRALVDLFPEGMIASPLLVEKVAVPGICLA